MAKVSPNAIVSMLDQSTCRFPMVFKKALHGANRQDIKDDLVAGLKALNLRYFPCMGQYNVARNRSVTWSGKDVLMIEWGKTAEEDAFLAITLSDEVKVMLQTSGLMYPSLVEKRLGHLVILPWMEQVIIIAVMKFFFKLFFNQKNVIIYSKITLLHFKFQFLSRIRKHRFSTHESLVKAATAVSAVALLEQRFFLPYDVLGQMMTGLQVTQAELQEWKVLGRNIMLRLNTTPIYHMEDSIRKTIEIPLPCTSQMKTDCTPPELEPEEEPALQESVTPIPKRKRIYKSTEIFPGGKRQYTEREEEIIRQIASENMDIRGSKRSRIMHGQFIRVCAQEDLLARTFHSFRAKLKRLGLD